MAETNDLPPVLDVVVELGIQRMRTRIGETGQDAFRPLLAVWVDAKSGMVMHFKIAEEQGGEARLAAQSLIEFSDRFHGVPRQVLTRRPGLATAIKPGWAKLGIDVIVRESLPLLDEAIKSLGDFQGLSGKPEPSLMDQPGMTLDHLMSFAEAAKLFYDAAPWGKLIDDDLIAIESPKGPKNTAFTQVLGAGGQEFGLGFVASRKAHEDIRALKGLPSGGVWSLLFDNIDSLPFDDADIWEQHQFPVANDHAYGQFLKYMKSSRPKLPTPEELAWAEGLLRAIAATTEDELDAGRWEKQVQTVTGPQTYKFSLPILLEQMSGKARNDPAQGFLRGRMQLEQMLRGMGQEMSKREAEKGGPLTPEERQGVMNDINQNKKSPAFQPTTPIEQAQALAYQAYEARGRRQVQLARQALAIDHDCTEAMLILAKRHVDPVLSLPLLRAATQAGARQLGKDFFEKNTGHFWGLTETRPYMRARQALALALFSSGDFNDDDLAEAITHFQDLLLLNPGDNQGNRYFLAQALLAAEQLDALNELLNHPEYKDDASPEWLYTRTLLAFIKGGDSPQARQLLAEAQQQNPMVPPLLMGHAEMPPFGSDSYAVGSVEEAVACVEQIATGWQETEGAIEWLGSVTDREANRAKQWSRERERKNKRKRK